MPCVSQVFSAEGSAAAGEVAASPPPTSQGCSSELPDVPSSTSLRASQEEPGPEKAGLCIVNQARRSCLLGKG